MDNNVGNEEEKVPVESSGATNKPSKKQAYLDYMRSRMGESYGEDEDSVYSDMLDYRQKNDESQERMTEILSKDPRPCTSPFGHGWRQKGGNFGSCTIFRKGYFGSRRRFGRVE